MFSARRSPSARMPARWLLMPKLVALSLAFSVISAQPAAAATVEVTAGSTITTIAGNGKAGFAGDGGPASAAQLNLPRDSAIGPDVSHGPHFTRTRRVINHRERC